MIHVAAAEEGHSVNPKINPLKCGNFGQYAVYGYAVPCKNVFSGGFPT